MTVESAPRRYGALREVLVFAAYLALAVLFLWPLSMRPFDTFAYVGDSLATVYFLAENGRRLWSEPWTLFSAGVAYPHENAALFEAHRLLPAFLAAPVVAMTGNPILAANLLGFIVYAFNAWAARRLALTLGISPAASFSAGALFAFNTYAVLEQPRLNIVFLGFIPLAIVETIAFARSGAPKHAWGMTGLWLAQAYTENYWLIYGGFVILPVLGVARVASGDAGNVPRRLRTLAAPALVAGLAFLPIALAYERMDGIYDYRREAPYSMDLSHFVATQPGNLLYGKIGPPVRAQQQGAHFVGFGVLLLAMVAVGSAVRRERSDRVWVFAAAGLAAACVLLAAGRTISLFGQELMPGPYGWLFDHARLFERTRIPERFGLLAMLPLSLLAARGIDLVARSRRVPALLLAAFLPFGHAQRFPWAESLPTGRDIPPVYAWLRESGARAVVEAPIHGEGLVRMESVDMYFQLFHRKPVVAAYVSFPPLLTRILRQAAEELPDPNALRTLALTGVDTVVYHQDEASLPPDWANAEAQGRLARRSLFTRSAFWLRPSGQDVVFSIPTATAVRPARPPARSLTRVRSPAWRYRASSGQAALAGDGDPDTQWVVEDTIHGGEWMQIGFGEEAVPVAAVALPLTRREILPTRFRVDVRDAEGNWSPFAIYGPAERDQLVEDLMRTPGRVVLTLLGEEVQATGIRLVADAGARSFDGWRLGEVEVLARAGGLK